VATWAFGNGNAFDLVALPRLASNELDRSYLVESARPAPNAASLREEIHFESAARAPGDRISVGLPHEGARRRFRDLSASWKSAREVGSGDTSPAMVLEA